MEKTNMEAAVNTALFTALFCGKLSRTERELNECYDPDRCHNGGGYHQPDGEILYHGCEVGWYRDISCGDFGVRFDAKLGTMEVHIDTMAAYAEKEVKNMHPGWVYDFMDSILSLRIVE